VTYKKAAGTAVHQTGPPRSADQLGGLIDVLIANSPPPTQAKKRAARRLEILALRSLELADRVAEHRIAFLDAIDIAYEAAVWSGLVDEVGDDVVQACMAAAFANARRP
jgi:hypothetical protein